MAKLSWQAGGAKIIKRVTGMRIVLVVLFLGLQGCSVIALPLHVAADVIDVVPVVGGVVAAPVEAVADIID